MDFNVVMHVAVLILIRGTTLRHRNAPYRIETTGISRQICFWVLEYISGKIHFRVGDIRGTWRPPPANAMIRYSRRRKLKCLAETLSYPGSV